MIHYVTQEDIDKGCQLNGQSCPVYRALKRSYPNVYHVYGDRVEYNCDSSTHPSVRPSKNLPKNAADFIFRFDDNLSANFLCGGLGFLRGRSNCTC